MKKNIIIDTDPGIDDSIALIFAGKSKKLNLLGVTTVAGNTTVENSTQNALNILNAIDRNDVTVHSGASKPWVKNPVFATETHGENGIGDIVLERSKNQADNDAVEFLYKTLKDNNDVTLIALGPLTNIANLLKEHPDSKRFIKDLVIMGGTYQSPGNCSPVAEFNFWFDPDAANYVFENFNKPITMVGLDVTRKALLTPNYIELIKQLDQQPLSQIITEMVKFYSDFHWNQERVLGCVINDPLAIAQVIQSDICTGFNSYVQIITEGPTIGMSMIDKMGILNKTSNCEVLTQCNSKEFFKLLLGTLFPNKEDIITNIIEDPIYGK